MLDSPSRTELALPPRADRRPVPTEGSHTPLPGPEPHLLSIHVTHATASLAEMEPLTQIPAPVLLEQARYLTGCDEAAVLATCNRVEFYLVTRSPEETERAAVEWLSGLVPPALLRTRLGLASCDHLLRVASGIESLIVGEDQILGQVKHSLELASEHRTAGRQLTRLFTKAIQVGKKVRNETAINKGAVSVGRAAAKLAEREAGVHGKRLVLVGTGEMASLVAKSLADAQPAELVVVSKTASRAATLARACGGTPAAFAELPGLLSRADILVTATSAPETILDAARLRSWLPSGKRLLIVDISNPRNVAEDVAGIEGVKLRDLDSLRTLAAENLDRRRAEVSRAETIVAEEIALLSARIAEERAEALLSALYSRMKRIRDAELERALNKLASPDRDRATVEALTNAIINKILAEPTLALKRMARANDPAGIETAAELFNLEGKSR